MLCNNDEAEIAFRKSLDLCEKSQAFVVFSELGHLFKFKGQNQVSADWFRNAIDARPDDAGAYIFLGSVLARDGKLLEAEAAHRSATQCDDGCIDEAYLNLGLILRSLRRYGEARQCFERALELDPEYQAAQDGAVVAGALYRSNPNTGDNESEKSLSPEAKEDWMVNT